MLEKYLNTTEAATFLKISKSTLYKLVMRKEIPYHKLGRRTLFDTDELIAFVNGDRDMNETIIQLNEFDEFNLPSLRAA
jgi:excisionase family DNA binding protein